jgi:hypothetical protein
MDFQIVHCGLLGIERSGVREDNLSPRGVVLSNWRVNGESITDRMIVIACTRANVRPAHSHGSGSSQKGF